MQDSKRIIIAFAIVFFVLIVWQFIFRPKPTVRPQVDLTEPEKIETAVVPETSKKEVKTSSKIEKLSKETIPEIETVLENPELRVILTNQGGTIKSVFLKKHKAELVPDDARLFSTIIQTEQEKWDLTDLMMKTKATDSTVEYETKLPGLTIKKIFRINQDYTLNLLIQLEGENSGHLILADAGLTPTEPNLGDDLNHFRFYTKSTNYFKGYSSKKLKTDLVNTDRLDWIGLRTKYFLICLVGLSNKFDTTNAYRLPDNRIAFSAGTNQEQKESSYLVYLGPLKYDILRHYGIGLENAVELGWPKPFSLAILKILDFLYKIFGNFGVAIIVFAIIMKTIFWPLTHSSTKQMRQMQLLQPKIAELKKLYKNDPQALNRETMQLYKTHKINPLSGCLPLIIQLPIFWALYSVFRSTIDLRQASFIFWLKDLSLKDPFYILPILMGVSFLAQNLLTSADKRNMALQVFMPIFLTVIFLNFPSGLQLYWFVYNILSIVESVIARKGGIQWLKQQPQIKPSTSLPSK